MTQFNTMEKLSLYHHLLISDLMNNAGKTNINLGENPTKESDVIFAIKNQIERITGKRPKFVDFYCITFTDNSSILKKFPFGDDVPHLLYTEKSDFGGFQKWIS